MGNVLPMVKSVKEGCCYQDGLSKESQTRARAGMCAWDEVSVMDAHGSAVPTISQEAEYRKEPGDSGEVRPLLSTPSPASTLMMPASTRRISGGTLELTSLDDAHVKTIPRPPLFTQASKRSLGSAMTRNESMVPQTSMLPPVLQLRGRTSMLLIEEVRALRLEALREANLPYKCEKVDMHRPLSHYWINSSHNTYLSGNQITSTSTPSAVIKALQRGARVVELDLFDTSAIALAAGLPKGPCVTHGGTQTKPASLMPFLEAIKEAGFTNAEGPVILTLENHLSEDGQRRCAEQLVEVFGDMLYIDTSIGIAEMREHLRQSGQTCTNLVDRENGNDGEESSPPRRPCDQCLWPTLASLRRRILVRDKVISIKEEHNNNNEDGDETGEEDEKNVSVVKRRKTRGSIKMLKSFLGREHENNNNNRNSFMNQDKGNEVIAVAHPDLARLVSVYNVKFKGSHRILDELPRLSCSINDGRLKKMLKKDGIEKWRRYTCSTLVRIYPKGLHLDSSNYDPQDAWSAGCQAVALNFQGSSLLHARSLWINAGKFRGNGGMGFIPKPLHMLPSECGFANAKPRSGRMFVTVIEGVGWDTFKDVDKVSLDLFGLLGGADSYVCVEIAGLAADRMAKYTKVFSSPKKTGPEAQPVWGETFEFDVSDIDLAVVLMTVWDKDPDFDDLLGQYAFPLAELRPGYRRVPLLNSDGDVQVEHPAVLCHFELIYT